MKFWAVVFGFMRTTDRQTHGRNTSNSLPVLLYTSDEKLINFKNYATPGMRSPHFCGTPTMTPGFKKLGLRLQALKIPRLPLRVKVGHRLLNLCDCDSVLSERWRQTNSQDFYLKNSNPILLRSYLNLTSVIACSRTVHPCFGLLCTIHYFIIFCKTVKTGTAYAESFFGKTATPTLQPWLPHMLFSVTNFPPNTKTFNSGVRRNDPYVSTPERAYWSAVK